MRVVEDEVAASLRPLGYKAGALHGDFTQSHREEMMGKFKRVGKIDIREQFTFVEVPIDIAEKVIAAMDNAFIRGKKIAVKKALPPMGPRPSVKPR